jgi:hypothetical protein
VRLSRTDLLVSRPQISVDSVDFCPLPSTLCPLPFALHTDINLMEVQLADRVERLPIPDPDDL